MLILAVETSCDDTAASVFLGPRQVLSSVVSSQEEVHREYGGVVPELASRRHMENIVPVVRAALDRAGVALGDIEAVAVTRGPGLLGSLFVGLMFAKAFAYARGLPFVGVNHLMGHLLAVFLEKEVAFPFVGLVVSGGHTSLYLAKGFLDYELLGETRDDAAGEAFDKVSKLLGLGYPGGPILERLAREGDPGAIPLPRPMMEEGFAFSFSGLKTAVRNYLARNPQPDVRALAASFQEAVFDVLISKTLKAAEVFGAPRVVVAGGVAANRRLRERFSQEAKARGIEVHFPSPRYCTDNAAMIALAGYELLRAGRRDPWELNALSRWPLGRL